jgi:hypothetical protein
MNTESRIKQLKNQLQAARMMVEQIEQELEKEKKHCKHAFYVEDDGDYHRRSYYYICMHCDYTTRMKPIS